MLATRSQVVEASSAGCGMDTTRLKTSWAAEELGDEVPQYFSSHLSLNHPGQRPMFPIQMTGQRDKLVRALGT